jgi:hypothetical protein
MPEKRMRLYKINEITETHSIKMYRRYIHGLSGSVSGQTKTQPKLPKSRHMKT